jgi:ELWxxDGT repeat protein
LWRSDGSEAGTGLVKDIYPGGYTSMLTSLTAVNDLLYFTANDGLAGQELWRSDGTESGTERVADIAFAQTQSSHPGELIEADGRLYFMAYDRHGRELWRSDGTEAGTYLVKDVNTESNQSPFYPTPTPAATPASAYTVLESVNDQVFFRANDGEHGSELWVSDGTEAGTNLVTDLNPTPQAGSNPIDLTAFNGQIAFRAFTPATGTELWLSDGTITNTVLLKDIRPGSATGNPYGLIVAGDTLFFSAGTAEHGNELWRSDGTEAGTVLVKDIYPGSYSSSAYTEAGVLENILYFGASDGVHGFEFWRSDGTADGTYLVKNIRPGYGGSSPMYFTPVEQTLYFVAYDSSHGLWASDGTEANTRKLMSGSSIAQLTPTNDHAPGEGRLFFIAHDDIHGLELWQSDGTITGTAMIRDIHPAGSAFPPIARYQRSQMIAYMNGIVYFTATEGVHGYELWQSDGTADGTSLLADINPGPPSSEPRDFIVVGNALYFTADDGIHGREVWRLGSNPPLALDDETETWMNRAVTIDVLANDSDPDGDPLTLISVTAPGNGTAVIAGEEIVYTPAPLYVGLDTFDYTIADPAGETSSATVTVTVHELFPPVASFDHNGPVVLGETAVFTNTSTGTAPLTPLWDFGDGATSTAANPTYVYTAAASYTVTLTITNTAGVSVATATFVIHPLPESKFTIFLPLALKLE